MMNRIQGVLGVRVRRRFPDGIARFGLVGVWLVALAACGGGEGGASAPPAPVGAAGSQVASAPPDERPDELLARIRTLMATGQRAYSAELVGFDAGDDGGLGAPIYDVRYLAPKVLSTAWSDIRLGGAISKEVFEDRVVVLFEFDPRLEAPTYDGEVAHLSSLGFPATISIHRWDAQTRSAGALLERYRFEGPLAADLHYVSDEAGAIEIPKHFFERVPLPNRS